MRLLKGNAFGWEADEERHEKIMDEADVDSNGEFHDPMMETQHIDYWMEEYKRDMEPGEYIPDEDFIFISSTRSVDN